MPAFEKRLAALEGTPVVINKWASWCNPCRAEFPVFQQLATERGREIAFLGVNSGDSTEPARKFLAEYPVPFPSYLDPDEKIAREIRAPANYPVTVFVDARGETAFIHQGGYTSAGAAGGGRRPLPGATSRPSAATRCGSTRSRA